MRQENADIKNSDNNNGEIIIYQSDDKYTKINVRMHYETSILTQAQLLSPVEERYLEAIKITEKKQIKPERR